MNFFGIQGGYDHERIGSSFCLKERHTGVDLIIADIPENLTVPFVTDPTDPNAIPPWNVRETGYVESILEFASIYLQRDGAVLLFHCEDPDLVHEVFENALTYEFILYKDWWGINELPLQSPKHGSRKVLCTTLLLSLMFKSLLFIVFSCVQFRLLMTFNLLTYSFVL